MPNWVKNIVYGYGKKEDILKVYREIKKDDDTFSFEKIIHRPKDLDIDCSSKGDLGLKLLYMAENDLIEKEMIERAYLSLNYFYKSIDDYHPNIDELTEAQKNEAIELGKMYLSNFKKYNHCTWYTWSVENWGTKWLCFCDEPTFVEIEDGLRVEYIFETAWSFPMPIFDALTNKYPSVHFEGFFADEDINSGNCGNWHRGYKKNITIYGNPTFAQQIWDYPSDDNKDYIKA